MATNSLQQPITSLTEIRQMKDGLRTELQENEKQVSELWQRLVTPPVQSGVMTPSKRVANMVGTSINVFDGLLLAWKLYRKFGGKRRLRF